MSTPTVAEKRSEGHHIRCETPKPRMAKAVLPELTLREKRAKWGAILCRARQLAGWDQQQTAEQLQVDRAQVSRWESGDENAHTWRYEAHTVLSGLLLVAKAEATQGAIVRTLIEVERKVG